jgi:hypothetical protein
MLTIPLSNSDRIVFVDDEDFPLLSRITWMLDAEGYVRNGNIRIHRLIMGLPHLCDHRDRNKLNNQKHNLRAAGRQQNAMNTPPRKNNASGFKGVCRSSRGAGWVAQINKTVGGKLEHYHLGTFSSPESAARVYDAKASELFGEFAYLNFGGINA